MVVCPEVPPLQGLVPLVTTSLPPPHSLWFDWLDPFLMGLGSVPCGSVIVADPRPVGSLAAAYGFTPDIEAGPGTCLGEDRASCSRQLRAQGMYPRRERLRVRLRPSLLAIPLPLRARVPGFAVMGMRS